MKAFHQAASVLSQCFDRILNLTAIIQPAYLFNGFLVTVRIFQVLNQIIRMTASLPAMCSQCSSIPLRFISLTGLAALWKNQIYSCLCVSTTLLYINPVSGRRNQTVQGNLPRPALSYHQRRYRAGYGKAGQRHHRLCRAGAGTQSIKISFPGIPQCRPVGTCHARGLSLGRKRRHLCR